uniref:Protein kinase domain-containing protein n=2 Tax=Aegilops tauschii subsp. strangulata TaxID=200361 RepID=A0A453HHB6_AEGTS
MHRHTTPTQSDLECMLRDEKVEPKALPLSLLEDISNGFSDEREIGRGGYAVVYKGMLENGAIVAVKRLSNTHMCEKEFQRELNV